MFKVPILCVGMFLAGASVWGQAVQLPQVQVFETRASANVPDRGRSVLSGVSRAGNWETRGLGKVSSGRVTGTAQTGVSVYVHDFEALEKEAESKPSRRKRSLEPVDQTFSEIGVKKTQPFSREKSRRTVSRTTLRADLNLSP